MIEDSVVRDFAFGVRVAASQAVTIDRSTIEACTPGIVVSNSRAVVTDSVIRGSTEGGVFCYGRGASRFVRCTFEKNAFSGIEAKDEAFVECTECVMRDNASDGALVQDEGRAYLTRCTIERSGASGVRVLRDGDVLLDRVTIDGSGASGIACTKGRCACIDGVVTRSGSNGIEAGAESHVAIVETRVADTLTDEEALMTGLLALEGGTLVATRCAIENNPCNVAGHGGDLTLIECRIVGGFDGMLIKGGTVRALRCEVTDTKNCGVQIYDGADPSFVDSSIHHNGADVMAYDEGRGRFARGTVGPSITDPTIEVQSGARTLFVGVTIAPGPAGELKTDGGEAVFEGCERRPASAPVAKVERADTTQRFDRALGDRFPKLQALLRPVLDVTAQDALEARIRRPLGELRRLLAWRDGQRESRSIFDNRYLMSSSEIADACKDLDELLDSGDFADPSWWSKTWIPFVANGGGDHFCLDSEGRVIEFLHEEAARPEIAPDLFTWLEAWTIALEAGLVEQTSTGVHCRYDAFIGKRSNRRA